MTAVCRKYALIDIDDTLSETWRRESLIASAGWDAFHEDSANDLPIQDMITVVNALHFGGMFCLGFTARPEKWRSVTNFWLADKTVHLDEVLMRPNDDYRPSPVAKLAMAVARFGSEDLVREHVAFIVDDREDVIRAFAGIGITGLHIHARRSTAV